MTTHTVRAGEALDMSWLAPGLTLSVNEIYQGVDLADQTKDGRRQEK
jgi:hypothetical protein